MSNRAWAPTLVVGLLLVGAGCLLPLAAVRTTYYSPPSGQGGQALYFRHYTVRSVLGCAVDAATPRVEEGEMHRVDVTARWPARLIVLAALAATCLVAIRRARGARAACVVLALSAAWLWLETEAWGTEITRATWSPYPTDNSSAPPVASAPGSGYAWAALVAGTVLLCASAWLRDGETATLRT